MSADKDQSFLGKECFFYDVAKHQHIKSFAAIAVSDDGSNVNPFGHLLLRVGGPMGFYKHVYNVADCPLILNSTEFLSYLNWKNAIVESEKKYFVPHPVRCHQKTHELSRKDWNYRFILKNCVRFVNTILQAGGVDTSSNIFPRYSIETELINQGNGFSRATKDGLVRV